MDTDARLRRLHGWTRMKIDIEPTLEALSEKIIGGAFAVSTTLGHGFLEAVYRNALSIELAMCGLKVQKEKSFLIHYRGEKIGSYIADLVVNECIVVELKVAEALAAQHTAQVLNYLKVSRLPVGLLLNFGRARLEVKRVLL